MLIVSVMACFLTCLKQFKYVCYTSRKIWFNEGEDGRLMYLFYFPNLRQVLTLIISLGLLGLHPLGRHQLCTASFEGYSTLVMVRWWR